MQGIGPTEAETAGLILDRIRLRAAGRDVLSDLSLSVPQGRFLAVLGGAGAGKSALVSVLAGTARADGGGMSREGRPIGRVPAHRRGFGVVAQQDALFPGLTLAENVAYPLRLRGVGRRERARLVEAALESVLLTGGRRLPGEASAAERQRAWIARATVFGPVLVVLDEPLSQQPQEARPLLLAALRRLHLVLGATTIMTTRVAADAMALADQVAVLSDGRVVQMGAPSALYDRPGSAVAALACGEANLLPGLVRAIDEDGLARVGLACGPVVEGQAAPGLRVRDACLFCLRPERVAVAPTSAAEMGEDALDAVVLEALYLGDVVRLRLLLGAGQDVLVKRPAAAGLRGLRPGEGVAVAWQPEHAWVFPEARTSF
jgi:putative spermidine/putrescine transport system ATP-binding protein